jgi:hypothetical protein
MVVVAQLVRASDCDSEGRGFEPPRLPIFQKTFQFILRGFFMSRLSWLKHPDVQSGGSGVRAPSITHHLETFQFILRGFFMSWLSWLKHPDVQSGGSGLDYPSFRNLSIYFDRFFYVVAQLVEASRCTIGRVGGSITNFLKSFN